MKIWTLSLSYKNASLEQRAAATISSAEERLPIVEGLEEWVWLQTCNRLELTAIGNLSSEEVLERWSRHCNLDRQVEEKFQKLESLSAITHLFRVTASLESMVLGENQIHGQVKKAYLESSQLGPNLHRCFQAAFRSAKRVRSETEVGQFAVSVPSIGVKLAQKVLGNFQDKIVGIIGLGEIGRISAEHFGSVGPKELLLYNRTETVAADLAEKLRLEGVAARAAHSIDDLLKKAHVIVSAASAVVLRRAELRELLKRDETPFILDLSVPPSVEAEASPNLFIYRVDDLQRIAAENSQLREQELERANRIVMEEAQKCWRGFESLSLGKTFELLSDKVASIRVKELEFLKKRVPRVSDEDWKEIEKMSERLSQKILQDPMMELRQLAEDELEKDTWLHFFRNMFKI